MMVYCCYIYTRIFYDLLALLLLYIYTRIFYDLLALLLLYIHQDFL